MLNRWRIASSQKKAKKKDSKIASYIFGSKTFFRSFSQSRSLFGFELLLFTFFLGWTLFLWVFHSKIRQNFACQHWDSNPELLDRKRERYLSYALYPPPPTTIIQGPHRGTTILIFLLKYAWPYSLRQSKLNISGLSKKPENPEPWKSNEERSHFNLANEKYFQILQKMKA